MLTEDKFVQWCQQLGLTEQTVKQIALIRGSPPARRVQSAAGNVSGRYPSQKMGMTIQFESYRNELAGIYEMEYDPEVVEYYDQPPPLRLRYQAKNGRKIGVLHTPDFFVLRAESAGWEEWKTSEELLRLSNKMPHRYQLGASGKWQCPPGETVAQALGLYYRLRSNREINWKLQRNLLFLEDYFRHENLSVIPERNNKIISIVSCFAGITLAELLSSGMPADEIYTMIALKQLYVDLSSYSLASEPERVQIFISNGSALAQVSSNREPRDFHQLIAIAVGMSGIWNGQRWQIVNMGSKQIALLGDDHQLIQLPKDVFNELIVSGDLTIISESERVNSQIYALLKSASQSDCAEANRRYQIIAPYLEGVSPRHPGVPERTFYRWVESWRQAEAMYGYGYVGLLPNISKRGNRLHKLPLATQKLLDEFILNEYENLKQKGKFAVYAALDKACGEQGITPPSYKTFAAQINQRPRYEQIVKRQGKRSAYNHSAFYWELELSTPKHGDRPFEIVHIDHTELDIELVSSQTNTNLGRPWATFLTDAFSRRVLAVYLSFDPPSYRSCMMVMRECVRRHSRLPQTVVVDGGKEFQSVYFEKLLAAYSCTKKTRPAARPRFGSVCERLFGTANTMLIHNLQGNTQITRSRRVVTKSVNPRNLAIWTLESLYLSLCDWAYEFYDNKEHPALGQSPRMAYEAGLVKTGFRSHKLIAYNETFRLSTLPTTTKGSAKVVPNLGVKINHIYYWHNSFRNPEVEKTQVPVRYDPYDVGTAYAYIKGQWVSCISQHYSSFHGHSEREIMVASEDLRKQHKNHSKQFAVTAKALAEFLNSTEAQEVVLLQRLRDRDAQEILSAIDVAPVGVKSEAPLDSGLSVELVSKELHDCLDKQAGEIEPYEEFW